MPKPKHDTEMTIEQLAGYLRELEERYYTDGEGRGLTMKQLCKGLGVTEYKARRLLDMAEDSGVLRCERVPRKGRDGVRRVVPVYRIAG